jgi:hypothetical protein
MSDLFPVLPRLFPVLSRVPRAIGRALWRATRCFGRGLRKFVIYVLPVLIVAHLSATLITGHMLKKELQRIRAAGQALTMSELAPRVPAGEKNAADIYQRAFDARRVSKDDEERLFPYPEQAHDKDWLALARRVVSVNGDYLALLDQSAQIPASAFPVKWDNPLEARFPHLARMRDVARMLSLRAEVLAGDGELDGAIASCGTGLRIAEHAKMEPVIIGQLVAYAIQGIEMTALERVLSKGMPSAQAARQLFDQLAATDQMTPFARAMQGERAFGVWMFRFVRSAPLRKVAEIVSLQGMPDMQPTRWQVAAGALYRTVGRPLLNLDELGYLRMWEKHSQAVQLPWPQSEKQEKAVEAALSHLPIYRAVVTRIIFPVFSRAIESRDRTTAQLRAAQIALALKAYHAERGRYPDSLAALDAAGRKLPTDPFGGKPFHYRPEGNGFVVWSIGPNMQDDGGRPRDALRGLSVEEKAKYDYDIPFRCAR